MGGDELEAVNSHHCLRKIGMKLNGNMKDKQGDSVTYFLKAEETYATKNTGKTEVPREVKIKDN